jgi:hypothetical protein
MLDSLAGGPPMVEGPRVPGMPRELRTHYNLPEGENAPY